MSNYTPTKALQALVYHADEANITGALRAVIDSLPEHISISDDMSSAAIVDLIFAELNGDGA